MMKKSLLKSALLSAILFFGGKKLPELGKSLGEAIKKFKQGMREPQEEEIKKDTQNLRFKPTEG